MPEHIRGLSAYVPGKPVRQAERESGSRSIKMPANENPFGPSPLAIAAIRQAANSTKLLSDNDANAMGVPNALRITIGTAEQNKTLIELLKRVLRTVPSRL